MITKEAKEMSIESIKNEIVNNLKNNLEVLKCLEIDSFISKRLENQNITNICDDLISNYGNGNNVLKNYISVEAEEHEFSVCNLNDYRRYKVIIKMGLKKENNLDRLAALVKEIIVKLYPNRKNYSNVPFYTKERNNTYETLKLKRMITFEVELFNSGQLNSII